MSPIQPNAAISGVKDTPTHGAQTGRADSDGSFANALEAETSKQDRVTLSAHARKRMSKRNVKFGDPERERLSEAVRRIDEKGADKSLVLMDNLALLVSARHGTVITVLDLANAKDAVFTNIDSAVII